jgi:autotransporter-associated beta strand protein
MLRSKYSLLIVVCSFLLGELAQAENIYWTNAAHDSLWTNPANWSTKTVPTSADELIFSQSSNSSVIDLAGTTQFVGPILSYGGHLFRNGTLVGGGIAGRQGDEFAVNLQPNPTYSGFSVNTSGGSVPVLISGIIGTPNGTGNAFSFSTEGATLTNANPYTGATTVHYYSSVLTLSGPNGSIAKSSSIELDAYATLRLDDSAGVNQTRVNPNAPITSDYASIIFDGNRTVDSVQAVGALSLGSGATTVGANSNGAAASLIFSVIVRAPGTALYLSPVGAGQTAGRVLAANSQSLNLIGGGGAAGTQTVSIVPFAFGPAGALVTYDNGPDNVRGTSDDRGLRALNPASECLSALPLSGQSQANVRLTTDQTVSTSVTANSLVLAGSSLSLTGGATFRITSGTLALSAGAKPTSISGSGTLDLGGSEGNFYIGSTDASQPNQLSVDVPITGSSGLTKAGTGTLVLTRPNSFGGALSLTEGTVVSRAQGALGSGTIYMVNGTILSLEGVDQTVDGRIMLPPGAKLEYAINELQVPTGLTTTLRSGISGYMSWSKWGGGTLLFGASSSLDVQQFGVDEGVVRIDGNAGQSEVDVGVGIVPATLGGSSRIHNVIVSQGATLWPGAGSESGTSSMAVENLSFGFQSSTFHVNLNGVTPGALYDQVVFGTPTHTGNVLELGLLSVSMGYNPVVGDHFMIIDDRAPHFGYQEFSGLPEGSIFSVGADQLQITYQGGDGNDVVLTVVGVPEPSAVGLLLIGGGMNLLRRRRRASAL